MNQYYIDITGISNNIYRFITYDVHTRIPNQSGIYVFLTEQYKQQFGFLYIGETESFYERIYLNLESHNAWGCALRNGITHLGIFPFSGSKQQRLDIETDIRNRNPTPCNLQ